MSNDTSKEKHMRQKITYSELPTKEIGEFMECGPVIVHTLNHSTKEVEAVCKFKASLVYKVIPGYRKTKQNCLKGKKMDAWEKKVVKKVHICMHMCALGIESKISGIQGKK